GVLEALPSAARTLRIEGRRSQLVLDRTGTRWRPRLASAPFHDLSTFPFRWHSPSPYGEGEILPVDLRLLDALLERLELPDEAEPGCAYGIPANELDVARRIVPRLPPGRLLVQAPRRYVEIGVEDIPAVPELQLRFRPPRLVEAIERHPDRFPQLILSGYGDLAFRRGPDGRFVEATLDGPLYGLGRHQATPAFLLRLKRLELVEPWRTGSRATLPRESFLRLLKQRGVAAVLGTVDGQVRIVDADLVLGGFKCR
ncbi:MAG: hypothetical protein AAF211_14420, partial [Myxococcota bacterium]